jgi:hypothetical protein
MKKWAMEVTCCQIMDTVGHTAEMKIIFMLAYSLSSKET